MIQIRQAELCDLPSIYRICLQTGESGSDATGLFDNPDLLGHVYAGPYFAFSPEFSFVAVDELGVAGYILAIPNATEFAKWAETNWWPSLREQYPIQDASTQDAQMIRQIHEPPQPPASILNRFPAELHIDLLPRVQGQGIGRKLMETALAKLRQVGISGVHLGVDALNTNAIGFYRHLGFQTVLQDQQVVWFGVVLSNQVPVEKDVHSIKSNVG